MQDILLRAKKASEQLRTASRPMREEVLRRIAAIIDQKRDEILAENRIDVDNAKQSGLSGSMIDRLTLTHNRLKDICDSVLAIASQPDPVGEVLSGQVRPNGMHILKIRVPLGVVGIIYESRPNVTIDCAALCLRSANVAILRGGKEAVNSNKIFADIVSEALEEVGLPKDAVILLDDPDRSKMLAMMQAVGFVDMVIPRGGENLIKFVTENARVPVVKHDKGVCHIYTDESADLNKSLPIIHNAKVSRPGTCNAVEILLVHEKIAETFLPLVYKNLKASNVEFRGCERTLKIIDAQRATEEDWGTEYLNLILAVKVVNSVDEAISHINTYGSNHSDAILTENYANAELFLNTVDSACVYVNASTRFTDGGEFGLGAEVGISTQKLHSRGPMGAYDLTTYKYMIRGNGQIR
jgi:glutamate-5-semialdehyde dehydrogenase